MYVADSSCKAKSVPLMLFFALAVPSKHHFLAAL
jgi:hypothetical protein